MKIKINKRILIPFVFISLTLFGLLATAWIGWHWYRYERKPNQPILFSHKLHIENAGLNCDHCHPYAAISPAAGLPPASVCMDCHKNVAVDKPGVKKMKSYWDRKDPFPWIKVYVQPGYVYFTHKRHIKAKIECSFCHGDVRTMTTVRQVRSLEMGWCVTCHRENQAPTECWLCHK
ncbi:MAG: cytochrome c family protein [Acidobacteria bacterium]|jgi:hypothetical protein|nr:cytochrome c family protein [Acidobacteriota bacterium]